MRILVISNLFPPAVIGGYEIACANVTQAMARRGHDMRVITTWCHRSYTSEAPAWVHRPLDLHYFVQNWLVPRESSHATVVEHDRHSAACSSYANTLHVLHRIRAFRPDIVYVWNLFGVGAAAILDLLNQLGVPWVLHLMDRTPVDICHHVPAPVLGLFNAHAAAVYDRARIISMSRHLLDEIESLSGIHFSHEPDIVPGWADVSDALVHEPYLRDGIARFVAAGVVIPQKGIDLILESCARLKADGVRFIVDVFGDGDVARYTEKARAMQVDDRFRLLGIRSQTELLRLYAGYDGFLFPTWEREPFGFAPIEAAGCGTPPIMTRNCGASERLVDGVHCTKIERTAQDLTDAMRRVASGGVDLARMGRAARRLVSTDLSFERCLDRIEVALRAHARPWRHSRADDPFLPLLAFLKHNLSVSLRFG